MFSTLQKVFPTASANWIGLALTDLAPKDEAFKSFIITTATFVLQERQCDALTEFVKCTEMEKSVKAYGDNITADRKMLVEMIRKTFRFCNQLKPLHWGLGEAGLRNNIFTARLRILMARCDHAYSSELPMHLVAATGLTVCSGILWPSPDYNNLNPDLVVRTGASKPLIAHITTSMRSISGVTNLFKTQPGMMTREYEAKAKRLITLVSNWDKGPDGLNRDSKDKRLTEWDTRFYEFQKFDLFAPLRNPLLPSTNKKAMRKLRQNSRDKFPLPMKVEDYPFNDVSDSEESNDESEHNAPATKARKKLDDDETHDLQKKLHHEASLAIKREREEEEEAKRLKEDKKKEEAKKKREEEARARRKQEEDKKARKEKEEEEKERARKKDEEEKERARRKREAEEEESRRKRKKEEEEEADKRKKEEEASKKRREEEKEEEKRKEDETSRRRDNDRRQRRRREDQRNNERSVRSEIDSSKSVPEAKGKDPLAEMADQYPLYRNKNPDNGWNFRRILQAQRINRNVCQKPPGLCPGTQFNVRTGKYEPCPRLHPWDQD